MAGLSEKVVGLWRPWVTITGSLQAPASFRAAAWTWSACETAIASKPLKVNSFFTVEKFEVRFE